MKIKLLILFSIFMLLFVSCEKDMKWINSNDSKIDQKETDKICQDAKAECGYIVSNYNGVSFEMFCGKCKEGYKCDDYSNTCQDIDECSDPLLNKCSSNTICANEEGTYSCICKENYSGKDCVPDTRLKDCENLPENAEWNSVSSITQTWSGEEWSPSNVGSFNTSSSTSECRFKCYENYSWKNSQCIADTKSVACSGLPENAEWNTVSEITQTWNGSDWTPSSKESYNEKASSTECRYKCKTNYTWKESKCLANAQTVSCTGLPENAEWNTVSEITQTWNGDAWAPSSKGSFNEEASEVECRFKCNEHYTYNTSTSTCDADTRTINCTDKPANSAWNDNGQNGTFTQIWNGETWEPENYTTEHSKTAGTCKFKCNEHYTYNESTLACDADTRTANCTAKPNYSTWNDNGHNGTFTQVWNGAEWIPATYTSSHGDAADICVFKCNTNYSYNLSTLTCDADKQQIKCPEKPANSIWNDDGANGEFTQTWSGSAWIPTSYNSEYNETAGICRYKCADSYHRENSACVFNSKTSTCTGLPANAQWNTASNITQNWNGTEWTPTTTGSYSTTASSSECRYKCKTNYNWNSSSKTCVAATQTGTCTGLPANAQWNTASSITQTWNGTEWTPTTTGSYNTTASSSECRYKCKTNYNWNSSSKTCVAATQTGTCTGLPTNAQWNSASSITQTWNGSAWAPTTTGSYNTTSSTSECRYKCKTNYNWNSSSKTCVAATQTASCTGLPTNAQWNTVSSITQTWNGSEWTPTTTGSYSTTSSTAYCRYKCKTNYNWNSSSKTCVAATQTVSCTGLPTNAQWNTATSIKQTWSGTEWTPSSTGSYNETSSTSECRYKCKTNYTFDGSSMCVVEGDTKTGTCSGLPANAEWNTASTITQTWNGSAWSPTTTGSYNTTASTDYCRYKCKSGYTRYNDECVNRRTVNCTGLPSNASWNTVSSITQTWDGSSWSPSSTGTYNETPSTNQCRFGCNMNYTWNPSTSKCDADTRPATCSSKPGNSVWNDNNANGSFTQTWNGTTWTPETYTSTYNTFSGTCRFKCLSNYFWSGSACVNPCNSNPCNNMAHSTKVCTPLSWQQFSCGCVSNYFWNGSACVNPCDAYPCSRVENSTGTCSPKSATAYSCACKENYTWQPLTLTCKADSRESDCTELPEYALWNHYSSIIQTWNGTEWAPTTVGVYDQTPNSNYCRFKCETGYAWNQDSAVCFPFTGLGNICTEQKKCYNNSLETICPADGQEFFGQDSQYALREICTPHSLSVVNTENSGENVIRDSNTGWEWQQTPPEETFTWENAANYCETIGYGGVDNWRLPTVHEILTIVDSGRNNPAFDTDYFTEMSDSDSVYFWTSESFGTNQALSLHTSDGEIDIFDFTKDSSLNVICVRGTEAAGSLFKSFTLNRKNVVRDTATGLLWQKEFVSGEKSWQDALQYCEKSTYADFTDWRLPNKNELSSLLKSGKTAAPFSDFPTIPSDIFWTSTTENGDAESAWIANFANGNLGKSAKTEIHPVICVRSDNYAAPGYCGDNDITGDEVCDDGDGFNGIYGGDCNATCSSTTYCGDGTVNNSEQCETTQDGKINYGTGVFNGGCTESSVYKSASASGSWTVSVDGIYEITVEGAQGGRGGDGYYRGGSGSTGGTQTSGTAGSYGSKIYAQYYLKKGTLLTYSAGFVGGNGEGNLSTSRRTGGNGGYGGSGYISGYSGSDGKNGESGSLCDDAGGGGGGGGGGGASAVKVGNTVLISARGGDGGEGGHGANNTSCIAIKYGGEGGAGGAGGGSDYYNYESGTGWAYYGNYTFSTSTSVTGEGTVTIKLVKYAPCTFSCQFAVPTSNYSNFTSCQ